MHETDPDSVHGGGSAQGTHELGLPPILLIHGEVGYDLGLEEHAYRFRKWHRLACAATGTYPDSQSSHAGAGSGRGLGIEVADDPADVDSLEMPTRSSAITGEGRGRSSAGDDVSVGVEVEEDAGGRGVEGGNNRGPGAGGL